MSDRTALIDGLASSLSRVAAQVFEDAAYIFTEPAEPAEGAQSPTTTAGIDFHGAVSGRIVIAAEPEFCADLAANMLGTETDDPEAGGKAKSALGEIANIIAGVWVADVFGADTLCTVGIPLVEDTPSDGLPASTENCRRLALSDDQGRNVELALCVSSPNEA